MSLTRKLHMQADLPWPFTRGRVCPSNDPNSCCRMLHAHCRNNRNNLNNCNSPMQNKLVPWRGTNLLQRRWYMTHSNPFIMYDRVLKPRSQCYCRCEQCGDLANFTFSERSLTSQSDLLGQWGQLGGGGAGRGQRKEILASCTEIVKHCLLYRKVVLLTSTGFFFT